MARGKRKAMISAIKILDSSPSIMPGVTEPDKMLTENLRAHENSESALTAIVLADGQNEFTSQLTSENTPNSSAKK